MTIAENEHLQFFIDDVLIHDFRDKTFAFGKVGVFVIHAHAHFDDFTITGDGIGKSSGLAGEIKPITVTWGQIRSRL